MKADYCINWRVVAAVIGGALGVGPAHGQLPDGAGKEEIMKRCSQCHRPEVAGSLRQDRAGWAATLRKMAALGAKGTDQEFRTALEYLATHFPADEVPRINVNTATAIELESGLTLRRSQAAAIVAYRLQHGDFKSIEDLEKVPGLDGATIEAKRDRLAF
jgi:competence protein ComEA